MISTGKRFFSLLIALLLAISLLFNWYQNYNLSDRISNWHQNYTLSDRINRWYQNYTQPQNTQPQNYTSNLNARCQFSNLESKVATVFDSRNMLRMFLSGYKRAFPKPCSVPLHIVVPDLEVSLFENWMQTQDFQNYHIHAEHIPPGLKGPLGQWTDFWADNYTSPETKYVMMFDTDTLPVIPFTCQSLFDEFGKPYLRYWTEFILGFNIASKKILENSPYVKNIGPPQYRIDLMDKMNGMSFFPMIIPLEILPILREALSSYVNSVRNTTLVFDQIYEFLPSELSQFDLMVKIISLLRPDLANVQGCTSLSKITMDDNCLHYVFVAEHVVYPSQGLALGSAGFKGQLSDNSVAYFAYARNLTRHGTCFQRAHFDPEAPAFGIEEDDLHCQIDDRLIPSDLFAYSNDHIRHDMEAVTEYYVMDQPGREYCTDPYMQQVIAYREMMDRNALTDPRRIYATGPVNVPGLEVNRMENSGL